MYKTVTSTLIAGLVLASAPAAAQYQDRSRAGRVADDIARTVEDTAQAVGRVRDSLDRSMYDVRFRGPERYAIDACRPEVERYGRMRVDQVQPYKRRGFKVYGTTEGYGGSYYRGYDRYGPRSFKCTVYDDGRIRVKTKKLRRY